MKIQPAPLFLSPLQPLSKSQVCVFAPQVIGCATAYYLSLKGVNATVIERFEVASCGEFRSVIFLGFAFVVLSQGRVPRAHLQGEIMYFCWF
jgi:hypothetical protein